jgi:sterol desaturase/sphingolipid hydroxylase (fatty acid hydroxylase superfamily)
LIVHDPEAIHPIPFAVSWLTWPIALSASVGATILAPQYGADPVAVSGAASVILILLLVAMERIWPADPTWKMTWRSFARDAQFLVVNGLTIAGTNTLFALVGGVAAEAHTGPLTSWPLWITVPVGIFAVDFIQYWEHRIAHESGGPLGRLMWLTHAAHHLPEQVYVLMHPASHPIYTFLVRATATILPLYLLGLTPQAVILVNLVAGVQGIISHSNLDLRAGWFNYIFVGPELHRYHHSATLEEAENYAVVLSLIDILFGTFVYRPGRLPERIGVADPAGYPRSGEVWKIMLLPFLPRIGRGRGAD